MSDERWSFLVAIIFSPIGWITVVVIVGAFGFMLSTISEIARGNKRRERKDGRNKRDC